MGSLLRRLRDRHPGIDANILKVAEAFDIVLWPCATDGKVHDIEKMADGSIDLCLFNGSVRTSEQEYMAQLLRRKAKVLVAFGSCASEGCIPGLANLNTREELFDTSYRDTPSTENPQNIRPQHETEVPEGTLYLPVLYDTVKTLGQTVPVDYSLPGCPPEADRIWEALVAILEGKLPAPGSVIGENSTVCDTCKRTRSEKKIKKFNRTWEIIPDEETCLLEQGLWSAAASPPGRAAARLCPQVNSPVHRLLRRATAGVEDYGSRS